jgi:hypothetical protein
MQTIEPESYKAYYQPVDRCRNENELPSTGKVAV